jgi:predicted PurR-regulated permease PerM
MSAPNPLNNPELEIKSLLLLVLAATLLFFIILWPFFGAVCWAVFIALVFWPLHGRFLHGSRGRKNMAALASLTVILLIVILPSALIIASITQEASVMVEKMRSGEIQIPQYFERMIQALPEWLRSVLQRFGMADLKLLQQKLLAAVGASGQVLTSRVVGIGQVTLDFIVAFFVMLYLLFFLFRDGEQLSQSIARAIPLQPQHTRRLLTQFATVVRATVKGNIVVALVQGALGSVAFWFLGVTGVALWGAVMALLSLLPAVGAAMVWGPVALYFFFTGAVVKGIGLTVWGALVIGLVDNVLRPVLVGKDTRMPDYLVLVATLGGIVVFGLNGFVIGPVIAAVFLVSWDMLASVRQQ